MARKYNRKVHLQEFKEGDLVLWKVKLVQKPQGEWKLATNWEGPYQVTKKIGRGAYKIAELRGRELPRTWNVSSLWKYYS